MGVLVVGGLALVGGLAAACFTKAFGIVFLGEARSDEAAHAHEAGAAMRWPMIILAGLCVLIGLAAPLWPHVLHPAVAVIVPNQSPLSLWERTRVRAVAEKDAGPHPGPSPKGRGEISQLTPSAH